MIIIGIIIILLLMQVCRLLRTVCKNQVTQAGQAYTLNQNLIKELRNPPAPPRGR